MSVLLKLGKDIEHGGRVDIVTDMTQTPHMVVVGGTGSGKSMFILYVLFSLLMNENPVKLYIGDFKKSGDYAGLSKIFAEFVEVVNLVDSFYQDFEETPEGNKEVKVLLLDEYAGFIIWLTQKDKKKCEEIKQKISNILMLGRSRNCFVIVVMQRFSAQLFPQGIGCKDNFGQCVGIGNLSVESRTSLFAGEHFEDEEFEKNFRGGKGRGLCLIEGKPLKALGVPYIKDKEKLKRLLRKMASERRGR